jgi:hypothetical protein
MSRPALRTTVLLGLLLGPTTLHAQWQWTLAISTASERGHARADDDPERPEIAPDHPATLSVGVSRSGAAWRIGLRLARTESDLAVRGLETAVVTRGTLAAWGVAVEMGRRVAGRTGAPELALLAGASLARWTFPGTGSEARILPAMHGAVEGQVPLRARWHAIVRGEVAIGGSLFREGELPLGYTTRPGQRAGIQLGVGWRP